MLRMRATDQSILQYNRISQKRPGEQGLLCSMHMQDKRHNRSLVSYLSVLHLLDSVGDDGANAVIDQLDLEGRMIGLSLVTD